MKFDKPFHIKLQPFYVIKEPTDMDELESFNEISNKLGGIGSVRVLDEINSDQEIYRSGGRMDWNLYAEPDSQKPEINVNLMRIWALQLVTQMINEKSFVNEIHSEPKFNINEEDKKTFLDTIVTMTNNLHDEIEKTFDSLVLKRKNNFNFVKDGAK